MSDEIVWINHAGYELRSSGLRIVHDPWIEGLAFADGWALLSESVYSDFDGVDYIWFSHEHPDHFSPATLRRIPEEVRRRITILFQKTRDGRVVGFCRKLGFAVQELPESQRVPLRNELFATCGTSGGDSWLCVETPEQTYLNANDVVGVDWAAIAARIGKPVDVLLAQFSYASWVGNPDENARMAWHAMHKLEMMDQQIEAIRPRIMIPFASYVWFCRAENFHLNAQANRIDTVYSRLKDHVSTVVLYPGDRYRVCEQFDSEASIARYMLDWAEHNQPLPLVDPVVPLEALKELSFKHQERLKKMNSLWLIKPLALLGFIRPIAIYLGDLGTGIRYDMLAGGIVASDIVSADCDIEVSSASFANMLRNGYGYDTLSINGRFLELRPDASLRLSKHFAIPAQNEQGYTVPGIFLRRDYLLEQAGRLWSTLSRRVLHGPRTQRA